MCMTVPDELKMEREIESEIEIEMERERRCHARMMACLWRGMGVDWYALF